jgi:hypothetical protein
VSNPITTSPRRRARLMAPSLSRRPGAGTAR